MMCRSHGWKALHLLLLGATTSAHLCFPLNSVGQTNARPAGGAMAFMSGGMGLSLRLGAGRSVGGVQVRARALAAPSLVFRPLNVCGVMANASTHLPSRMQRWNPHLPEITVPKCPRAISWPWLTAGHRLWWRDVFVASVSVAGVVSPQSSAVPPRTWC